MYEYFFLLGVQYGMTVKTSEDNIKQGAELLTIVLNGYLTASKQADKKLTFEEYLTLVDIYTRHCEKSQEKASMADKKKR
jgi:hypothetical protein